MPLTQQQAQFLAERLEKIISAPGGVPKRIEVLQSAAGAIPAVNNFYVRITPSDAASVASFRALFDRAGNGVSVVDFGAASFDDLISHDGVDGLNFFAAPACHVDVAHNDNFEALSESVEKIGLLEVAITQLRDVYRDSNPSLSHALAGASVIKVGDDYQIVTNGHGADVRQMIIDYVDSVPEDSVTSNGDVVTLSGFAGKTADEMANISRMIAVCGVFESVVKDLQRVLPSPDREIFAGVKVIREGNGYKICTDSHKNSQRVSEILNKYKPGFIGNISPTAADDQWQGAVVSGLGADLPTQLNNLKFFSERMRGAQLLTHAVRGFIYSASLPDSEKAALATATVVLDGDDYKIVSEPRIRSDAVLPLIHRCLGGALHARDDGGVIKFTNLAGPEDLRLSKVMKIASRIDAYGELEIAIQQNLQLIPGLSLETIQALRTAKVTRQDDTSFGLDISPATQYGIIVEMMNRYTNNFIFNDNGVLKFNFAAGVSEGEKLGNIFVAAKNIAFAAHAESVVRSLADLDIDEAAKKELRNAKINPVVDAAGAVSYGIVADAASPQANAFISLINNYSGNLGLNADTITRVEGAVALQRFVDNIRIVNPRNPTQKAEVIFDAASGNYEIIHSHLTPAVRLAFANNLPGEFIVHTDDGRLLLRSMVGERTLAQALEPISSAIRLKDRLSTLWASYGPGENPFAENKAGSWTNLEDLESRQVKVGVAPDGKLEIKVPLSTSVGFREFQAENFRKLLSGYFEKDLEVRVVQRPWPLENEYNLIIPVTDDLRSFAGIEEFIKRAAENRAAEVAKTRFDPQDPFRSRVVSSVLGPVGVVAGFAASAPYLFTDGLVRIPVLKAVTSPLLSPVVSLFGSVAQSGFEAAASASRSFGFNGTAKYFQDLSKTIADSQTQRLKKVGDNPVTFVVNGAFSTASSFVGAAVHIAVAAPTHFVGDALLGYSDRVIKSQKSNFGKFVAAVATSPFALVGGCFRAVGMATETIGNVLVRPGEYASAVSDDSDLRTIKPWSRFFGDVGKAALSRTRMFSREQIFVPKEVVPHEVRKSFSLAGGFEDLSTWTTHYRDLPHTMDSLKKMLRDAAQVVPLSISQIGVSSGIDGDSKKYLELPEVKINVHGSMHRLRPLVDSNGEVVIVDVNTVGANSAVTTLTPAALREFGSKFFEAVSVVREPASTAKKSSLSYFAEEYRAAADSGVSKFVARLEEELTAKGKIKAVVTTLADGSSRVNYSVNLDSVNKYDVQVTRSGDGALSHLRIKRSGESDYRDLTPVNVAADGRVLSVDPDVLKIISAVTPEKKIDASERLSGSTSQAAGVPSPSPAGAGALPIIDGRRSPYR